MEKVKQKNDRISYYLKRRLDEFVFDVLSPDFLKKLETEELMNGVPVPFRKKEFEEFMKGEPVRLENIAKNIAYVFGADSGFKYKEHYMGFLIKVFGDNVLRSIEKEAETAAEEERFEDACAYFRASLCIKPDGLSGLYGYARVCREIYLKGGDEELVGSFKAESIKLFELITEKYEDFADSYYYLGYAYTNLGLYVKADLIWKEFLKKSDDNEKKEEIKERCMQLEQPVKIELGCNDVLAGRFADGIAKLEPYTEGQFSNWWPLWYYLGISYNETGELLNAEKAFKKALFLNPSNVEIMELLAQIYRAKGDTANEEKYRKKSLLVRSQLIERDGN